MDLLLGLFLSGYHVLFVIPLLKGEEPNVPFQALTAMIKDLGETTDETEVHLLLIENEMRSKK